MCECIKEHDNDILLKTKKYEVSFNISHSLPKEGDKISFGISAGDPWGDSVYEEFIFCPWCGKKIEEESNVS